MFGITARYTDQAGAWCYETEWRETREEVEAIRKAWKKDARYTEISRIFFVRRRGAGAVL